MSNDKLKISLSFLRLSSNYLLLVRNALKEAIKQGNIFVVIKDHKISEKELNDETKWSDFNIIIPILFNFYHGLELLMKGFLILKKKTDLKKTHNIKNLLNNFCVDYNKNIEVINFLKKYTDIKFMPKILSTFLKENKIGIDEFYIFLKYPTDKNSSKIYNYFKLKYNEEKGLILFKEIIDDIDHLLPEAVKIYREKENKNQQL